MAGHGILLFPFWFLWNRRLTLVSPAGFSLLGPEVSAN